MKHTVVHMLVFFLLIGMGGLTSGINLNDAYCQAWGEPHIQTWSNGNTSRSGYCFVSGWHPLMVNKWISFNIRISNHYTVEAIIDFRGASLNSVCNIQWHADFRMTATTSLCNIQGINITTVKDGFLDSTRIYYNQAGITIIVIYDSDVNHPHLNIKLQKPPDQNATGLCTDNQCNNFRSGSLSPPFKISKQVATIICQDYLDAYFEKLSLTPSQRNRQYNDTIRMFQESCIFDVAVTGQADAAASAIQMLMVQDLTHNAPTVRSAAPNFQTGFLKASHFYEQAKSEAKAKIARKHILQ